MRGKRRAIQKNAEKTLLKAAVERFLVEPTIDEKASNDIESSSEGLNSKYMLSGPASRYVIYSSAQYMVENLEALNYGRVVAAVNSFSPYAA